MTFEQRDLFLGIAFYGMLGISAITFLYPWRFRGRASRVLVHLPLILIPVFPVYSKTMNDAGYNIRVDLLVLLPVLLSTALVYVFKVLLLWRSIRQRKGSGA